MAARSLGIPSSYAFDYEFARVAARSRLPGREARRRPGGDPAGPARPSRSERAQGAALPGPQGGVLPPRLRAASERPGRARPRSQPRSSSSCARLRTFRSTTATGTRCSRTCSSGSGADPSVQAVVLPRTAEQRDAIRARDLPSLVVPEQAIDAQSLVALADLVVSAGGTMNREAVALGVPVYTTFAGRLGRGRHRPRERRKLRVLSSADELSRREGDSPGRTDGPRSRRAARPDAFGARALARMSRSVRVPRVSRGKGRDVKRRRSRRPAGWHGCSVGAAPPPQLRRRQRQRLQDRAARDAQPRHGQAWRSRRS